MQIIDFQLALNTFLSLMEILLLRESFHQLCEGDLWESSRLFFRRVLDLAWKVLAFKYVKVGPNPRF